MLESEVTGIMVYYYYVCKRKLWYYLHEIRMESENQDVKLGKILDANSYMLRGELNKYVRKDIDSVILFTSRDERWLNKEFIGKVDDKTSRFL